jgi:hypothetical protein
MAKTVIPIFSSTITTYTWSSGANSDNVEGVELENDFPPEAQNVASILIYGTAAKTITFTVTCKLKIGGLWGDGHNVLNDSDSSTFTIGTSVGYFEANLYSQSWWKMCDAFKIVLTAKSSADACSGSAGATLI